jgi:hypothetical protein
MIDSTPWAHRSHRGRPTVVIDLTADQRTEVETILLAPSVPQGAARRAQALLLFADGVPASDVARLLGVHERTVFKWHKRFAGPHPVSAVADVPKSGRPVSLFPLPIALAS